MDTLNEVDCSVCTSVVCTHMHRSSVCWRCVKCNTGVCTVCVFTLQLYDLCTCQCLAVFSLGYRPGNLHQVKLRGLPYSSDKDTIQKFLLPLQPTSIEIIFDNYGRHSGEALVTFSTQQEVDEAIKKDKEYMGTCVHVCVCVCSACACACVCVHVCVHMCNLTVNLCSHPFLLFNGTLYIHTYMYVFQCMILQHVVPLQVKGTLMC